MLKLYNTLSRKIEEFKPIEADEVKLYTCGPTVYDFVQIGNLRSFVFDDLLRRTLELDGYKVKHVMNITDVGHLVSDMDEGEDKLEKSASREGRSVWEVSKFYNEAFQKDVKELNFLAPNGYVGPDGPYAKATDFIDEQIEIVRLLIDKGFAYQTKQAIYFDITKLASYGELSGQKLSDKQVGARSDVITDSDKHHPQDFALWFFLVGRFANHSMHWDSPWGKGFPGWHLECSAIIHKTLGDPIDIHTGGVDHIGTHHPNEMAQTEAAFGHKLANFWVHNEFVMVDGQKMSKSLGNFYTLEDIKMKGYDPLALRLLFLQAHYRSQLNFTWDALEAAAQNLKDLNNWADLIYQPEIGLEINSSQLEAEIKKALNNDLGSPAALAALNNELNDGRPAKQLLSFIDKALGFNFSDREDISNRQKELIAERESARKSQDWSKADRIRVELKGSGIEINDADAGPIWLRI